MGCNRRDSEQPAPRQGIEVFSGKEPLIFLHKEPFVLSSRGSCTSSDMQGNLSTNPTSRKVAKRLQGTFQELLGPTHRWPVNIRETIMVGRRLNNADRLKVFWFLSNNGVDPDLVIQWAENKFLLDG